MQHKFLGDESGSILPLFAIALIPIFTAVGAAVDYSRTASARSEMQASLDAAALMLSKEAVNLNNADLNARAKVILESIFSRADASGITVAAQLSEFGYGYKLRLNGAGTVDTRFMSLVGTQKMAFRTSSEVVWGTRRLEIALALDSTGSMASSNKMDELKKAAKNLIESLKSSVKKEGDVKIAIIPFNTVVNVGKHNVGASWLDWTEWDEENGEDVSTQTCTGKKGKKKKCTTSTTWVPDDHKKWSGCVADRSQDHDVRDTAPSSDRTTQFPAVQEENCPVEMTPLTTQWGKLVSRIESMKPEGNTNVTIGLMWAWHALTESAPLTEGGSVKADLDKVIVLLTDGDNTENRWSTTRSEIDARTQKACGNAKLADIKVYTIRVINGNSSLLRGCATTPQMYYDVQQASQLNAVFAAIAKDLMSLRISE